MTEEIQLPSNIPVAAELKELFGPPPVLSSEDANAYDEAWARIRACLKPGDFMEELMIRHVADTTWEVRRYTRHKGMAIERKFTQRLEYQAKRVKENAKRRQALGQEAAERASMPATELKRFCELDDFVDGTIEEVDEILARVPKERDHARALEDGIEYQERLDKMLNNAIMRYNIALKQLEQYRDCLSPQLRLVTGEIIDANDEAPQVTAPSLAPAEASAT